MYYALVPWCWMTLLLFVRLNLEAGLFDALFKAKLVYNPIFFKNFLNLVSWFFWIFYLGTQTDIQFYLSFLIIIYLISKY